MPVTSPKQFRFMEANAHGNGSGRISPSVAQEFLDKTSHAQKSKFARGKMPKVNGKEPDLDDVKKKISSKFMSNFAKKKGKKSVKPY